MEKLKFSILACVYGNQKQFNNFLWTAYCQDFDNYEIVIFDNATPGSAIENSCKSCPKKIRRRIKYHFIQPRDKKCKNITQGINLAAREAKGEYLVIVADSNVLLSFNLLESIEALIDENCVVLSAGCNDVKISPDGSYDTEYAAENSEKIAVINQQLLKDMGWPCDPLQLRLLQGKHRFPPPHLTFDCYIVALAKTAFLDQGGYNEDQKSWGEYHQVFVQKMTRAFQSRYLNGVRIVHQYHRVFKDVSI